MRDCDIGTDEVVLGQKPERLGELGGGDVEPGVGGIDARGAQGGIVHLRRAGVGNRIANDGEADGGSIAGGGGGPIPEIGQGVDGFGHSGRSCFTEDRKDRKGRKEGGAGKVVGGMLNIRGFAGRLVGLTNDEYD
jgi:hypothetical protein